MGDKKMVNSGTIKVPLTQEELATLPGVGGDSLYGVPQKTGDYHIGLFNLENAKDIKALESVMNGGIAGTHKVFSMETRFFESGQCKALVQWMEYKDGKA